MQHNNRGLVIVGAVAMLGVMAGFVEAQKADVKQVEIVSVDGNSVVVRGDQGTEQIAVTDDVHLTVDGRPISVRDLKPGMKGTARTTITTSVATPVQQSTDVKRGEIVKRRGTSVIAKMPETKTYTDEELAAQNIPVTVAGKPVKMSSLWEGTKLVETTVTTTPERVATERHVELVLAAPPATRAEATPPVTEPAPEPVATTGTNPEPEAQVARQLPRTASLLPALGLFGAASSAAGLLLTMRRRRSGNKSW